MPEQYSYSDMIQPSYSYSTRLPQNHATYQTAYPFIDPIMINPVNNKPSNWASSNLGPQYLPPPPQSFYQKPYRAPTIQKPYLAPIARLSTKKPITADRYIYKPVKPTQPLANDIENQIQNSIKQHSQLINEAFQNKVQELNNNNFNKVPFAANEMQNNEQFQNYQNNRVISLPNQFQQAQGSYNRDGSEDIDVRFDQRPDSVIQNQNEFKINLLRPISALQSQSVTQDTKNDLIHSLSNKLQSESNSQKLPKENVNKTLGQGSPTQLENTHHFNPAQQQDELVENVVTSEMFSEAPGSTTSVTNKITIAMVEAVTTQNTANQSQTTIKNRKTDEYSAAPSYKEKVNSTKSTTIKMRVSTKAPKENQASSLLANDVQSVLSNYENSTTFSVTTIKNDLLENDDGATTEFEDRIGDNVIKTLLGG